MEGWNEKELKGSRKMQRKKLEGGKGEKSDLEMEREREGRREKERRSKEGELTGAREQGSVPERLEFGGKLELERILR